MQRAAAIIVTSARYRDSSAELAPFRDKCHVIPLGIDPSAFEQADPAAIARIHQQYGDRLILSVGRLVPYKGIRYLIEAMASVDGCLLHIGTGPPQTELAEQVRAADLSSKVQMLGRVDDLAPYLHAAAMLALPSITRAESFGIAQLEAMAAGLPVINTSIESGVPEVSLHGVTGLTVPPADASSLAEAINLLLGDPEMRRHMGDAGKLRARAEFSIDRMAADTVALYESILTPDINSPDMYPPDTNSR